MFGCHTWNHTPRQRASGKARRATPYPRHSERLDDLLVRPPPGAIKVVTLPALLLAPPLMCLLDQLVSPRGREVFAEGRRRHRDGDYASSRVAETARTHVDHRTLRTEHGQLSRLLSRRPCRSPPVIESDACAAIDAVDQKPMDIALRALVGRDWPTSLFLEPDVDPGFGGMSAHEVDEALREAFDQLLLEGERQTFAGPEVLWSNPRLRTEGLEHLGEWPPSEGEHLTGPWDDGYWGEHALPALQGLAQNPPPGRFVFGPEGGMSNEEWVGWYAVLRLLDRGLIDGDLEPGGLSDVHITAAGTRVLTPPPRDPLSVAEIALRQGNKVEATIAALEEALGGRLRELAEAYQVPLVDERCRPKNSARVNSDLKANGAYDETERAQVEAWLKLRNEAGHGRGEAVSSGRIETMLAGIGVFLANHPPEG